tara:strand:- start:140 stop:244 length:105 start_codon:yes stop_codon:yes gene_type:complete
MGVHHLYGFNKKGFYFLEQAFDFASLSTTQVEKR